MISIPQDPPEPSAIPVAEIIAAFLTAIWLQKMLDAQADREREEPA